MWCNYASQVQIQASQAGDKVSATVEFIAPGIDLAVLKLDDDKFFDTHPPLARAKTLPGIKDTVLTYGFPEGGNNLSITKGIVSRVEFAPYNFPVFGLRIQMDAAINPGNSGGPAVVGDKMIGLTFSRLNDAENIGYIIPSEEIDLFLQDIADGHYDGKPAMYDDHADAGKSRPALLSETAAQRGRAWWCTNRTSDDAAYPLKEWDVITKIGDMPVDDQGMIRMSDALRVGFTLSNAAPCHQGHRAPDHYPRRPEEHIRLPVSADYPKLIPSLNGGYPSYFIYRAAGLFHRHPGLSGRLSPHKICHHPPDAIQRASANPLLTRMGDQPAFPGEGLVVISSPFFPDKLAQGYGSPRAEVVKSINGIPVKNLGHLVGILRDAKDEFLTIAFAGDGRFSETMIFPRAQMLAATDGILTDNGVRSQGSPDTLAIWNAKPAK